MVEAALGKTIYEDIKPDIFERLYQFAYTGNYTTPEFKSVKLPASTASNDSKSIKLILEPEIELEP
jgi:hypothetical protein